MEKASGVNKRLRDLYFRGQREKQDSVNVGVSARDVTTPTGAVGAQSYVERGSRGSA